MIDALFGSKTRIKLLHLFMNNPGKSFYVREITRLVDEQINSVRRELSNMLNIGIITSNTSDNKLFYEVNQRYEHYLPLRAMFSDQKLGIEPTVQMVDTNWRSYIKELSGVRIAVASGVLVPGSTSKVDLIVVGNVVAAKLKKAVSEIERIEGRDVNYSLLPYDEFYYRLSIHDKFITEILKSKHLVLVDTDNVLKG